MPTITSRTIRTVSATIGLTAVCLLAGVGSSSAYLKVAAAGDISCPPDSTAKHAIKPGQPSLRPAAEKCQGRRVAKLINEGDPDVVLALGDLIQGQTSYRSAYRDFDRAWGLLGNRIVSTIGNHDYHLGANGKFTASGYFRYWKAKKAPTWRVGRYGKGWTSWNAGTWHMINLNANCSVGDCTFTGPQLRWLIRDLRKNRANPKTECTLAYFHQPLFSTGFPRGKAGKKSTLANLWELLYRYRTDLVLNGHQQHYERFLPQDPSGHKDPTGITEIISGTGGTSTFPIVNADGSIARNSDAAFRGLGTTFLKLGARTYSSSFRDLAGNFRDKQARRKCLRKNAGHNRRKPRARRYRRQMREMASLAGRIGHLGKKIRRLKKIRRPDKTNHRASRRYARVHRRYAKAKRKRTGLLAKRARVRERRLYY